MAFWDRRPGNRVYVYYWSKEKQKQVALKREHTKHLDAEPDHNIDAWVKQFSEQHENKKYDLEAFLTDQLLDTRLQSFEAWLHANERDSKTVHQHCANLKKRVFQYFLTHGLNDPNHWPARSPKMIDWLRDKGETDHTIYRCNVALRRFWKWLYIERYLVTPYDLLLQNPPGYFAEQETPLEVPIKPEQIYTYLNNCKDDDLRLLVLLGYFCSLRPQETYALRRADFKTGSNAQKEECCKAMKNAGLYDRLAVDIHRQRKADGKFGPPKTRGWVACFEEKAARLIVEILLKHQDREKVLMSVKNRRLRAKWTCTDKGKGGPRLPNIHGKIVLVDPKDLRRASLYHLGTYEDMNLTTLINHARHTDPKTTRKYLRRPYHANTDNVDDLNLDA